MQGLFLCCKLQLFNINIRCAAPLVFYINKLPTNITMLRTFRSMESHLWKGTGEGFWRIKSGRTVPLRQPQYL